MPLQTRVQEVNDKDAQQKKPNFGVPEVMTTYDDLSKNERCADLRKFIEYLQAINLGNPLTCILHDDAGPCDYSIARRYLKDHPGKSKDAAEILRRDADLVGEEDFIKVVRTYFCGTHDFSMGSGRKAFRVHFLKLWNEASDKSRAEVWDALRKCERNIFPRGPSTPQQGRPGLNRAVNSVPKEVPRASVVMTPSLDMTMGTLIRPRTAQGNNTQEPKPFQFSSDATPSKTSQAPIGIPIVSPTKSETDSSGITSHGLPESPSDRSSVLEAQQSPSSDMKVAGSSTMHGSTRIKLDPISKFRAKSITTPSALFGGTMEPVGPLKVHMGPDSSLEGTDFSFLSRLKTPERKVSELKFPRSPLFDMEAPIAKEPPYWWPKRDNDLHLKLPPSEKSQEGTFVPFKGESMFDRLRNDHQKGSKDRNCTPQNSIALPQLTSPSEEAQEAVSRSPTPEIEFQLPGAWIDSCETPVTPKSNPTALTPEPRSPSDSQQSIPQQTAVRQSVAKTGQTPRISHRQSIERAPFADARDESKEFENLANELQSLDISSPVLTMPLPQGAIHSSCIFPARNVASTARQIRKILKKELTGSIYVLEAPEFFSTYFGPSRDRTETWYKIGIAADVDERVRQIKSACGISDLREVYSTDPNIRYDVLKLIEAVCHAQLNNSRRYMDCGKYGASSRCIQKHEEWFAVPRDVAISTVKMWKTFLDFNPYGHDGVLDEGWSKSLKNNYPLLEHDGRLDQDKLLHQSLEAWIRRTAESQN